MTIFFKTSAASVAYKTELAHLAQCDVAQDIEPFADHYNGYVRQAAIARCVALNTPGLLPIAASRLNDWVPQVRDAARAAIITLASVSDANELLSILPGVLRLHAARRTDHTEWITAFEAMLTRRLSAQDLTTGISSPNIAVSRAAFHLARKTEKIERQDLIVLALSRRNDLLLAQGALALIGELPAPLRRRWYEEICISHFQSLRVGSLRSRLQEASHAADALAIAALRDKTVRMRDVAMHYLRGRDYDIRGFYRDVLLDNGTSARLACIALHALGGLRDASDVPLVQRFAHAATPAVRETALAAWLRLAPDSKDEIALLALSDTVPAVRQFALTVVRKHHAYIPFAQARAILTALHDERRMLRLAEVHPWLWLETLVEVAGKLDATSATMIMCRDSAQAWRRQGGRYYTAPSALQLSRFTTPASLRILQELGIAEAWLHPI
jgi:hypothetical protein